MPTSWGYQAKPQPSSQTTNVQKTLDPIILIPEATSSSNSNGQKEKNDFVELFAFVATIDPTPYLCIPEALRFRQVVCGGEERIRQYCENIAQIGGQRVAQILGTEVMQNSTHTLTNCSFVNVRLPLTFTGPPPLAAAVTDCILPQSGDNGVVVLEAEEGFAGLKIISQNDHHSPPPPPPPRTNELDIKNDMTRKIFNREDAPRIVMWIIERALIDFDIPIMMKFHANAVWIRLSGQIYIELQDLERAAEVLKELCDRVYNIF